MRVEPAVVAAIVLLGGCSGADSVADGEVPVLPADYLATYQEVRNCRFSLDHDLGRIHILAAPDALGTYTSRTGEFVPGAIVVKEEYDGGDTACAGPITSFSVMQKLEAGSSPDTLDWTWQKLDQTGTKVVTEDVKRCISCHTDCGAAPEGFGGTCAVP